MAAALSPEDRALIEMMRDGELFPLKPGQMLLLGPRSIAILVGRVEFKGGKLPDKHVYKESEWKR